MITAEFSQKLQAPSYIVGTNGRPVAVVIDLMTWQAILHQLEDIEDFEILQAATPMIDALSQGQSLEGWKSWQEFEAELDELENVGALPA